MSVKTIKYFTKFNADYAKQVFFRLSSLSKNQFSVEILTKKTTMVTVKPLSLWFLNLFFHGKFTVYFIIYIYSMLTVCNKMSFTYGKIKQKILFIGGGRFRVLIMIPFVTAICSLRISQRYKKKCITFFASFISFICFVTKRQRVI